MSRIRAGRDIGTSPKLNIHPVNCPDPNAVEDDHVGCDSGVESTAPVCVTVTNPVQICRPHLLRRGGRSTTFTGARRRRRIPLPLHRFCRARMAALLLLFLALAPWARAPERPFVTLGDPSAPETSVCEALRAHGLPIGLLPRGAREFRIDEEGRFEVRLGRACSARFEGEMRYDANVTGTLSYGQIGGLSGVTAQELFLWFPVTGIRVDDPGSGLIFFDVGVLRKQFPLSLFEIPPDCDIAVPPAADLFKDGEIAMPVEKSKSGEVKYKTDRK